MKFFPVPVAEALVVEPDDRKLLYSTIGLRLGRPRERNRMSKMARLSETPKLTAMVAAYTFTWVVVYFPLETFVTWSIAGPRGLVNPSYIENIVGMGLMLWGAVSARRGRPFA